MVEYTIEQLPSGFWCVWCGSEWINASLPSREAAEKFVKDLSRRRRRNTK